ncbi:Putative Holin-X, holin superfamily III [Jatrophihabitans endophyticus]|uniref:Putative Holin-X, holin superfamily III n=1 Tax=Jatrophihabitans endophyticus TaxID=1206085 RepID=A0A1M5E754_9ACTN|nr:phage holin family protein [Jatrophihabitans endophyticus]SHF74881.1 Putative Holin-X, holin superfamily III [Jatrophihabitans endophyticus]
MTSSAPRPAGSATDDASIGQLASQLSEQVSRLVRDELALAQAETKEKGKKLGVGAGAFGGTAVLALYALGVLIAAAVLGLATAVDAWLAAVIVGVVLLLIAGVLALVGKSNVSKASPPVPTDAIHSVQADVDAVKGAVKR